jgi:hypothetical protein
MKIIFGIAQQTANLLSRRIQRLKLVIAPSSATEVVAFEDFPPLGRGGPARRAC